MKLFDHVSEDARKLIEQTEGMTPCTVTWGHGDDSRCPITAQLEAFFTGARLGRSCDESLGVSIQFTRNVPDGILRTVVSISGSRWTEYADLRLDLERFSDAALCITNLQFRANTLNVSPKTVGFVHQWVRDRARPYFLNAREQRESESRAQQELRHRYKP